MFAISEQAAGVFPGRPVFANVQSLRVPPGGEECGVVTLRAVPSGGLLRRKGLSLSYLPTPLPSHCKFN